MRNSLIRPLICYHCLDSCMAVLPVFLYGLFSLSFLPSYHLCVFMYLHLIFFVIPKSHFSLFFFFFPCYLILKMTIILAKSCVILLPNQIFYNCLQYVSSKTSSAYAFFTKVLWTAHK
jgi:hypothetical protein